MTTPDSCPEPARAHSIQEHFAKMPDARIDRTKRHLLSDILVMGLCAMICGADDFVEMANFARCQQDWFAERLQLANGIPSHDTFNRVFAAMDPVAFEECSRSWITALHEAVRQSDGTVLALDGKTLRHSFDKASEKASVHIVSAWAVSTGLVLGQVKVDDKSNEITAIPQLLHLLDITGCIVMIDAMGCQKEIARQIVEQGGDYLLGLKDNQPNLHHEVKSYLLSAAEHDFDGLPHGYCETLDKGHGRIEIRRCWTVASAGLQACLDPDNQWHGLNSIVMVESQRQVRGKVSVETRFFISSLPGNGDKSAKRIARRVRAHWGIENKLHWLLDMAFREDDSRAHTKNAATNLATLRHMAINLIRQDTTIKAGVKTRRHCAGWNLDYLAHILTI